MTPAAVSVPAPFSIGDVVVYARHGVGTIDNVESVDFRGDCYSCFAISVKASGIKVLVPVEKAGELGLRSLEKESSLVRALEILACKEEIEEFQNLKSWKERKKILDELFKSGQPVELAKIVRFLYQKNQGKDLPNSERKIYDSALKFLIDELAEVKQISEDEADHLIAEALI